ncbi:EAL domain-containing protein [Paucibacter sp. O1-1]|uniref:GGDEF/EAL domain-containing response regulator n=1 Tax=Paucibacter sp. M5-1 TaxID=3015998 RepID=UPI0021D4C333|nr:EAL domain-containing protein [Paucibacter sp. M5-1]MCU7373702.1 EAL domain-containing protein [Paucibacter sp. O1-1]MCZ7879995.1 EAL domain-containing protein [Paucibacter sp. M5-1]MDA3828703.1 EAL domain-containing protein [Paucibacter sp. O1-1]
MPDNMHPASAPEDDLLEFLDHPEGADQAGHEPLSPWRVLIVDDDADVHKATELAMQGLKIEGRPLIFLHASSASQARALMSQEHELAVVLLDVVMESENAGLQLVRQIREELNQHAVRIVLRTGQPGYAPEIETVQAYDINDYKTKSELTRTRLYTVLTAAIRSYKQICALEANRQGLEMIVEASTELSRLRGLHRFAEGVVTQLCALLGILPEGLVCAQAGTDAGGKLGDVRIVAAAGQYSGLINAPLASVQVVTVRERLQRCLQQRRHLFENGTCLYFGLASGRSMAALVDVGRELDAMELQLLRAFCSNIVVGFENVMLYSQLLDHAYSDQLLRLPNRVRFIELLDQNLKDPAGITLALIDLDDFSDVNDAFGHGFGDQVLQSVALRLGETLGLNTSMARVAADVFGLMGPEVVVNSDSIRAVFAEPFDVAGERLQISATTGLVRLAESASVGSELLLDAQIALKRAKQQHRGASQYFSPAMGTDARERFKLLKGLRAGFEENRLFVVYQPQVDLASALPLGAEALLRWRTEDGKFVPPDQFIPLAEQSGLIISIGEFVLRTACHQLKRMEDQGYGDFRMCVNISLAQFRHPGFVASLNSALQDTGVNARNLELEITESMAMEDTELVLHLLADIKRTGATVAIDDFGTGFSSLSHLRQLDVERLKIDRAFVREAQNSSAGLTIAQMVINLGRGLGLTVIAEGVETEQQRQQLLALGCHEGQGWLFARPMPAEQLESWMQQTRAPGLPLQISAG